MVQSGSDSTLGITFIDGTVFGLASNAKMVLNEMIYDPNGSNNSSLISLVQGTISFVAGATAKHGDMKVDTPVATMGIRGTAVLVEIDFVVPGQGGAPPAKFQVLVEPDGTTGSYILFDKTTLTPIATVNQAGTQTIVNGQGTVNFLSSAQLSADAQKIITDVFSLKFTDLNNPQYQADAEFHRFDRSGNAVREAGERDDRPRDGAGHCHVPTSTAAPSSTTHRQQRDHIPGPPDVATTTTRFTEHVGVTGSPTHRHACPARSTMPTSTPAMFRPSRRSSIRSPTRMRQDNDVTASLTAEQLAAIAGGGSAAGRGAGSRRQQTPARRPGPTASPTAPSTSSPPARR